MVTEKTQYTIRDTQYFKNKRILITAGPTWVPIDNVRVISNIATGETGILLAELLQKKGARVSLLLGPVQACCLHKNIRLIRFKFFGELKNLISRELNSKKYDIVIHSAAVSDYKPSRVYPNKLKPGNKNGSLSLVPTEKLINIIKKINRSLFLVGFKFEQKVRKPTLINEARRLIQASNADLVVANTIYNGKYNAYLVGTKNTSEAITSKKGLAAELINAIGGQ